MSNATINSRTVTFQDTLAELPWTPNHAEQSAKLALSKAERLGLDNHQAIAQIFERGIAGFFQANQHIPFQA